MNTRIVKKLGLLILAALLAVFCAPPLRASDPAPSSRTIAVNLIEKDGRVVSDPAMPAYDFGQRDATDASPVARVFLLQNKTGHALTIDLLEPSCGCITAWVDTNPDHGLPYALKPGAGVPIRVSFAPESLTPGPLEKHVSVFLHGQASAVAILQIKGMVMPLPHPS